MEQSLTLAVMGFKLRNEGSYLGIIWYLLNPLLMFLLLLVIFSNNLGGDIEHYPIYLLTGIIMVNFFLAATSESTRIIRANKGTIRSINYGRESLIGSIVLVAIFSHLFELLMLAIVMLIFGISPLGAAIYLLVLFVFSLFTLGVCLILSSIAVYFMDLDNIWSFASKLLWFATPIFYSTSGEEGLSVVILFNPLYHFLTIARSLIIYHEIPSIMLVAGALGSTAVIFLSGLFLFGRFKKRFAEMI
jgi:ABC-type polysaccharide/polyol phosphate export permease